jgi:predicted site-specific integrase-resolvase
MGYITVNGTDYVQVQTLAEALGVCTATLYNWKKAGHFDFEWPLGKALTFVSRQTAERLMRLKITSAMGAFARSMEAVN